MAKDDDVVGEPKTYGKIVRSELMAVAYDESRKLETGWTCNGIYNGTEVYPVPLGWTFGEPWPDHYSPDPITFKEGLQPGDVITFWGVPGTVEETSTGLLVRTPSGTVGLLYWNEDDRHCWTCGGVYSASALRLIQMMNQ